MHINVYITYIEMSVVKVKVPSPSSDQLCIWGLRKNSHEIPPRAAIYS